MTKDSRFPWGISLLVFGIMFLLRQIGVFSPETDDLIFDLRNLFYLKYIILWSRNLSDFIWPVLLIAAGTLLLFSSKKTVNNSTEITKRDENNTENT